MKLPDCLRRFVVDFKRKEFASLKILYFLVFGALVTITPFLAIHARSLGIKEKEVGTINGLLPIFGILAPALAGGIADKIGNFKIFLSFTMCISGLSALIYLLVPPARIIHIVPRQLPLDINCTYHGSNIEVHYPYSCELRDVEAVTINITSCSYICSPESDVEVTFPWSEEPNLCPITDNCVTNSSLNGTITPGSNEGQFATFDSYQFSFSDQLIFDLQIDKDNESHFLKLNSDVCPDHRLFLKLKEHYYKHEAEQTVPLESICWLRCTSTVNREEMCTNTQSVEEKHVTLTLTVYIVARCINFITLVCSQPLFEGAAVAILKRGKGDFGFQKLYANVAQVVWTPISGVLIDAFSDGSNVNFAPAFYLCCILKFCCAFVVLFVDLEFKKPAKRLLKDLKSLICSIEVITLLLAGFTVGTAHGIVGTFLFWLLEDLGAPRSVMGVTSTVGASFGIPLLIFSTPIIQKLGHMNTLILGLGFFFIRLIGLSFITKPWMAMLFETLDCFTNSLFAVAAISYISELSTSSTVASMQGLYTGITFGFGKGTGSMVSGFLIHVIGLRRSFQLSAAVCAFVAIICFVLNFFWLNGIANKRKEKQSKEDVDIVKNNIQQKIEKQNMENNMVDGFKSNNISLEEMNNHGNDFCTAVNEKVGPLSMK